MSPHGGATNLTGRRGKRVQSHFWPFGTLWLAKAPGAKRPIRDVIIIQHWNQVGPALRVNIRSTIWCGGLRLCGVWCGRRRWEYTS